MLAAAAAAAPLLREWLAARFQSPSANTAPAGPGIIPASPGDHGSLTSHAADVSFVPTSASLTINVSGANGDSMEVRTTPFEAVHVRGRGTEGEPTVVVLPDRVQLVSSPGGTTAYSVEVPPNVRVVEIRHDGRVWARLAREALDAQGMWRARLP